MTQPPGPMPAETETAPRSAGRRIVAAVIASDIGALAIAAGGFLSFSAGLLVLAAVIGGVVGWILHGQLGTARTASVVATAIALSGVLIGQVLLWALAMAEGGVLGPIDYLAQTFGLLVPAQLAVAAAAAWVTAR